MSRKSMDYNLLRVRPDAKSDVVIGTKSGGGLDTKSDVGLDKNTKIYIKVDDKKTGGVKKSIDKKALIDKNAPIDKKAPNAKFAKKPKGKKYSLDDVKELVKGYVRMDKSMWGEIPNGAHIRYVKRDTGEKLPLEERFKPGGFCRNHFTKDGKEFIRVETKPGAKEGAGNISFSIAYDNVEIIWKKIDNTVHSELTMVMASLAERKRQHDSLAERVKILEDILKSIVRKK